MSRGLKKGLLHKIFKRLIYITLLALMSCCQAADAPPIKIALVGPFTGEYAAYGTQLLSGAMQAVNDINSHGGLKGVKLEIVPVDDQCNPDIAVRQAESIVASKGYQAVIGHVCSAAALATTNIYSKANLLVITPTATNPKLTQRHIATQFRMCGNDVHQAQAAANFIVQKLRSKRIAILHDQDLYSKDLADLVGEHLAKLDATPILYQELPRGTRNFTAIVKKIKQLKADAIYFAGLYPEVSGLAKTLHVLEMQIPFISADGIALQKFVQSAGGSRFAESVLMTFTTNPSSLLSSKTVIHEMQQKHLETTGYSLYAYAAVQVIAQAVEHVNNTDGKNLANWLHHHEVDTVLGKKSWDTNGDIIEANFNIYTWHGESELEIVT